MGGALSRLINHPLSIGVCFRNDFLITFLRFREFLPDFFGVELPFLDFAPPIFQDGNDWLVSEPPEEKGNDREADHLREKEPRIPAEGFGGITEHLTEASRCRSGNHCRHNDKIHALRLSACSPRMISAAKGRGRRTQLLR